VNTINSNIKLTISAPNWVKHILMILVGYTLCGLIVFLIYEGLNYFGFMTYSKLTFGGHVLEAFCLNIILLMGLIFTRRIVFSLMLTLIIYSFFIYANIEKSAQLLTPIFFNDLTNIKQLTLVKGVFLPYIPILFSYTLILILTFVAGFKIERRHTFLVKFHLLNILLVLVIVISIIIFKTEIKDNLRFKFSIKTNNSHALTTAEKYGFLFFFVKDALYSEKIKTLESYSAGRIAIIKTKIPEASASHVSNVESPSLIIYFIESFADPVRAGIKTTADAIPFFRSLTRNHLSGQVYSPVFGGNSANSEFELLTGFSMHFFPKSSIPYIDLPYREIPSLARELSHQGYHSSSVQPVDLGLFNYKHIYQMLGFDETISLWDKDGIEKDPAGRYPSDSSVVKEIIKVSEQNDRFFIFAFPNSTHSNWNYSAYDDSPLDLDLESPLRFPGGAKQLKTYINSLNTADNAIQELIQHFEKVKKPIAILVVGDHQPGLPEFREQTLSNITNNKLNFDNRKSMKIEFKKFREQNPVKSFKHFHSVPFVLWTNYEFGHQHSYQKGMNSLILTMFDFLGLEPKSPFYHYLKHYSNQVSYESLLEFTYALKQSEEQQDSQWHQDFEAIQYDLLIGEEHILK